MMEKKIFLIFAVSFLISSIFYLTFSDLTIIGNFLFIFFSLLPVLIGTKVLRSLGQKSDEKLFWSLFVIGCLCFCIAETTWAYYEIINEEAPYPGIADIFYIIGYPFVLIFVLSYTFAKPFSKKAVLTTLFLFLLLLIICFFLELYDLFVSEEPFINKIVSSLYVIYDLVIFSFGLYPTLTSKVRNERLQWLMITIGFFLFMIADVLFSFVEQHTGYKVGNLLDLFYFAGYISLATGAIYKLAFEKESKNSDKNKTDRIQN
jgi:hypothetical protein